MEDGHNAVLVKRDKQANFMGPKYHPQIGGFSLVMKWNLLSAMTTVLPSDYVSTIVRITRKLSLFVNFLGVHGHGSLPT